MKKMINLILMVGFIWFLLSYGEICFKNLNPNAHYSKYNIIVNLTNSYANDTNK